MKNKTTIIEKRIKQLEAGEIYIWHTAFTGTALYERLLSPDEKEKASRFVFKRDRNRYIMRHGILRTLLGVYLDIEPDRIRFQFGKNGKPSVMNGYSTSRINFSLSHSDDTAVFAFSSEFELGVDVENIRDIPEMDRIFRQYFSLNENKTFHILTENNKREAFFNCWTRKEAYVKATGDGLATPLRSFDVSLIPGEPARLLRAEGNPEDVFLWSMYSIEDIPGYKGALAVKGQNNKIYSRHLTEQLIRA